MGDIPVFDDFMLLVDAENIDDCTRDARLAPGDLDMQDHVIPVDKRLLNFAVRVGIFVLQESDKLLKTLFAIFCHRVVLNVTIAEVGLRGSKILVV